MVGQNMNFKYWGVGVANGYEITVPWLIFPRDPNLTNLIYKYSEKLGVEYQISIFFLHNYKYLKLISCE